jgi:hypothetical protein
MILKHKLLFVFGFLPILLFSQREQVNLKVRNAAPMRKFEYHQMSSFDVVNGKMNVALASSNGYLFEIIGISTKSLKCSTILKQNQFKVVLIDNRLNKTYVSNQKSKGTLRVNCMPDGKYELIFVGDIFNDNQKVTVTSNLVGAIAHSSNIKN